MYYIYALYSKDDDKIYIGQTCNVELRLSQHNAKRGRHYTANAKGKWQIIYIETVESKKDALKREKQLKSYRGRQFIKTHIPG